MSTHDGDRALSFGGEAERYDRARPRYPAQLVDDLTRGAVMRVLDVGCGTGIAAEAFQDRGCTVLGVEPDARMAVVARRKGIPTEVARFEDWDAADREFDLVMVGQAWHWLDHEAALMKARAVLVPGGTLALFWNLCEHHPDTVTALDAVYARHAPTLREGSLILGRSPLDRGHFDAQAVTRGGLFAEPEVRHYRWNQEYSAAHWLELIRTHSDHRVLPASTLDALLADIGTVIDDRGGSLVIQGRTVLITPHPRDALRTRHREQPPTGRCSFIRLTAI